MSATGVSAAELVFRVESAEGEPLADAAVVAEPLAAGRPAPRAREAGVVDQIDKTFVPHVAVIRSGTAVKFPNRDDIRHHVYSFSPAKTFELPLYKGTPAEPVVFDQPGVVVLGCNIHDFMQGYIYVTDAPYYAVTGADGGARLSGVPAGRYRLHAWHPSQGADAAPAWREVELDDTAERVERFVVEAAGGGLRLRRAPRPGAAGYR